MRVSVQFASSEFAEKCSIGGYGSVHHVKNQLIPLSFVFHFKLCINFHVTVTNRAYSISIKNKSYEKASIHNHFINNYDLFNSSGC